MIPDWGIWKNTSSFSFRQRVSSRWESISAQTVSPRVDVTTYDSAMKEAWGEHYISTEEITTQPQASYEGQAEIANAVYQKLIELNYISK